MLRVGLHFLPVKSSSHYFLVVLPAVLPQLHISSFENLRYLKKEAMSSRAQNYKCTDIGNKSFNLTENIIKMCFHESAVF